MVRLMLFLSTPSARRATPTAHTRWFLCINFYPRPPRGGRPQNTQSAVDTKQFLSTPSARRATKTVADRHKALEISIHALREEGDAAYLLRLAESRYFYPRPPRGGRLLLPLTAARSSIFLSTPSARRATQQAGGAGNGPSNFYPRPPRGGRLDVLLRAAAHSSISIHALREEGDRYGSSFKPAFVRFLSTPSARRATTEVGVHALAKGISIHALREEGDTPDAAFRSPVPVFLSTPSARRATSTANIYAYEANDFYPRPPRGGRPKANSIEVETLNFYPRPPRGGRHQRAVEDMRKADFYPRPPRGGRRNAIKDILLLVLISIHALREEGDPSRSRTGRSFRHFYPRPPRGGRPGEIYKGGINI